MHRCGGAGCQVLAGQGRSQPSLLSPACREASVESAVLSWHEALDSSLGLWGRGVPRVPGSGPQTR